jgi:hypothetical protein
MKKFALCILFIFAASPIHAEPSKDKFSNFIYINKGNIMPCNANSVVEEYPCLTKNHLKLDAEILISMDLVRVIDSVKDTKPITQ